MAQFTERQRRWIDQFLERHGGNGAGANPLPTSGGTAQPLQQKVPGGQPPPAPAQPALDKLIQAIKAGNIAEVKKLLAQLGPQLKAGKISLDNAGSKGLTPLTQAAEIDSQAIAELLLDNPDKKADIDAQDAELRTALFVAVDKDQQDMVEFLLKRNASPNIAAKKKVTPLMVAADERVAELLIGKGANVDDQDEDGKTALATSYKGKVVQFLLSKNADADKLDNDDKTALMVKFESGNELHAEMLLPATKKVNQQDKKFERTVLIEAVLQKKDSFVTKLLADQRVDPNIHDKAGNTALIYAARQGELGIVNILLTSKKVKIDEVNTKSKESALIAAAVDAHADVVAALLAKNKTPAHLNLQDADGNTALIAAIDVWPLKKGDRTRILQELVAAGADRSKSNTNGSTAWSIAKTKSQTPSDPATQKEIEDIMALVDYRPAKNPPPKP
jgi:ankyrin repeat protein